MKCNEEWQHISNETEGARTKTEPTLRASISRRSSVFSLCVDESSERIAEMSWSRSAMCDSNVVIYSNQ